MAQFSIPEGRTALPGSASRPRQIYPENLRSFKTGSESADLFRDSGSVASEMRNKILLEKERPVPIRFEVGIKPVSVFIYLVFIGIQQVNLTAEGVYPLSQAKQG